MTSQFLSGAASVLLYGLAEQAYAAGDRLAAEAFVETLARSAPKSGEPFADHWQREASALKALWNADLAECVRLSLSGGPRSDEANSGATAYGAMVLAVRPLLELGRPNEAAALVEASSLAGLGVGQRWFRVLVDGRRSDASLTITGLDLLLAGLSEQELASVPVRYLMNGLDAAVAAKHTSAAEAIALALTPVAERIDGLTAVTVGRLLGDAARLLGDDTAALGHYQTALRVSEAAGCKPEIALVRLALAELLLDGDPVERRAALAHLDAAIADLREFRMRPALERALSRRELLKA